MKYCFNHTDRRVFSKGLCAACYKINYKQPLKRTPLKKKPFFILSKKKFYKIKPVANKRAKQLQAYSSLRKQFLIDNPLCQIKGQDCLLIATEIHHSIGRENELLLDVSKFVATCHNCHRDITDNSKTALEQGHSLSKYKIKSHETI